MILFPAIDLKAGQCVRLALGEMDTAQVFNENPADQACEFANMGSEWLHMVDLDGAFAGDNRNQAAIDAVIDAVPHMKIQLGGGIRTRAAIDGWLDKGVHRVILGTAALKDPDLVKAAAKDHPGAIVVAVDAKDGFVAVEGWAETSEVSVTDLAKRFEDAGVAALLFTDVGRDGLLKGVNIDATVALANATTLPVIASGGLADMDDLKALLQAAQNAYGQIEGVISGKALYDGRLDLKAALAMLKAAD